MAAPTFCARFLRLPLAVAGGGGGGGPTPRSGGAALLTASDAVLLAGGSTGGGAYGDELTAVSFGDLSAAPVPGVAFPDGGGAGGGSRDSLAVHRIVVGEARESEAALVAVGNTCASPPPPGAPAAPVPHEHELRIYVLPEAKAAAAATWTLARPASVLDTGAAAGSDASNRMPVARIGAATCARERRIFVFGGVTTEAHQAAHGGGDGPAVHPRGSAAVAAAAASPVYLNDVFYASWHRADAMYAPTVKLCSGITGKPPSPRAFASVVITDPRTYRLLIHGGVNGSGPLNDLHVVELAAPSMVMSWSTPLCTGPQLLPRMRAAMMVVPMPPATVPSGAAAGAGGGSGDEALRLVVIFGGKAGAGADDAHGDSEGNLMAPTVLAVPTGPLTPAARYTVHRVDDDALSWGRCLTDAAGDYAAVTRYLPPSPRAGMCIAQLPTVVATSALGQTMLEAMRRSVGASVGGGGGGPEPGQKRTRGGAATTAAAAITSSIGPLRSAGNRAVALGTGWEVAALERSVCIFAYGGDGAGGALYNDGYILQIVRNELLPAMPADVVAEARAATVPPPAPPALHAAVASGRKGRAGSTSAASHLASVPSGAVGLPLSAPLAAHRRALAPVPEDEDEGMGVGAVGAGRAAGSWAGRGGAARYDRMDGHGADDGGDEGEGEMEARAAKRARRGGGAASLASGASALSVGSGGGGGGVSAEMLLSVLARLGAGGGGGGGGAGDGMGGAGAGAAAVVPPAAPAFPVSVALDAASLSAVQSAVRAQLTEALMPLHANVQGLAQTVASSASSGITRDMLADSLHALSRDLRSAMDASSDKVAREVAASQMNERSLASAVQGLRGTVDAVDAGVAGLQRAFTESRRTETEMTRVMEARQADALKASVLEAERDGLREQVKALAAQVEAALSRAAAAEERVKSLTATVAAVEGRHAEAVAEAAAARARLERTIAERAAVEERWAELQRAVARPLHMSGDGGVSVRRDAGPASGSGSGAGAGGGGGGGARLSTSGAGAFMNAFGGNGGDAGVASHHHALYGGHGRDTTAAAGGGSGARRDSATSGAPHGGTVGRLAGRGSTEQHSHGYPHASTSGVGGFGQGDPLGVSGGGTHADSTGDTLRG